MVLDSDVPVCMPTKTLQLLNTAESTMPVTKQQTTSIMSPCFGSTKPKSPALEKCAFIDGALDEGERSNGVRSDMSNNMQCD